MATKQIYTSSVIMNAILNSKFYTIVYIYNIIIRRADSDSGGGVEDVHPLKFAKHGLSSARYLH